MRPFLRLLPLLVVLSPITALAQPGGSVVFRGTQVTALGGATVALASSRLFVGNLGSSGLDGVHLNTGGSHGIHVAWPAALPAFTQMRLVFNTGSAGIEPCFLVNKGIVNTSIVPDFSSMGASGYRVEVWNAGQPVSHADLTFAEMVLATPDLMSFDLDTNGAALPLPVSIPLPASARYGPTLVLSLKFAAAGTFQGPAGSIGFGDELRLLPDNNASGVSEINGNDILITMSQPSFSMTFDDVAQRMFGSLHRGTESATILCNPTTGITMSLVPGTPGCLQTEMYPSDTSKSITQNLKLAAAGDTDEFSVVGELLTGGQAEVGRVSGSCNGSSWMLTPDFSGSLSSSAHVQLFSAAGTLVAESPNVTSALLVGTNAHPVETVVDGSSEVWGLSLCYAYASPVPVMLPGAGTFTASRIAMHSNAPRRHKFFAIIDRTQLSTLGGLNYDVRGEANSVHFQAHAGGTGAVEPLSHNRGVDAWATTEGKAFLQPGFECLRASRIGASSMDRIEFQPLGPTEGFGIAWAPLGPPSANTGETDWAFLSKLASDSAPVRRMGIHLSSDGSMVSVMADPGASPTTQFHVFLRDGTGQIVAEFVHSNLSGPLAALPTWPIGVSYTELVTPGEPWAMYLHFGFQCNVTLLDRLMGARRTLAAPIAASVMEIRAEGTPNPGPSEKTVLSGQLMDIPFMLFRDGQPVVTAIDDTPRFPGTVLLPAYPNPFNPRTTLAFVLSRGGHVSLKIYAVDGSHVATVHEGTLAAGPHAFEWTGVNRDGQSVASGVYVAELRAPDGKWRTKVNLLK